MAGGIRYCTIWCLCAPLRWGCWLRKDGALLRHHILFALGAGLGSKSAAQLGGRAIWISCGLLLVSFALMFIREELEENPVIEKDLTAIRQETREIDRTLKQELQEQQRELKQSARK